MRGEIKEVLKGIFCMHLRILIIFIQQNTPVFALTKNSQSVIIFAQRTLKYFINENFEKGETENVRLCRKSH